MNRYETEVDLRRVVEKRIGKRVEDPHWEESGPQWTGPYDALDLEEILTRFKRCGSRKTRAQSSDSLEGATIQSSYESEERALSCLQTVEEARLEHFGSTAIPFHDLPSVSQWIRHLWRTERPVPVGKIGSLGSCSACGKPAFFKDSGELIRQDESVLLRWPSCEEYWAETGEDVKFHSPRDEGTAIHVKPNGNLGTLFRYSNGLSIQLGCTESQATAFILLGWIPVAPPVSYTINEGKLRRITIEFDVSVPTSVVLDSVKEARKELTSSTGERVRLSPKTAQKRAFIKRHEGEGYEAMRRRWNRGHPNDTVDDWRTLYRYKYKRKGTK